MGDALTTAQFGRYGDRVLDHFEQAYGFGWHAVDGESEFATESRRRLRAGIDQATQAPPPIDERSLELLARIYRLRQRILDTLNPTTAAWRQQVSDLGTAASLVGQRLADLSDVRGLRDLSDEQRGRLTDTVATLVASWADVEVALDAARYNSLSDGSDITQADVLRAIADDVGRAAATLVDLTQVGSSTNLGTVVQRVWDAVAALTVALGKAIADAPAPFDYTQRKPFSDYFQRLLYALPVTEYVAPRKDPNSPRRSWYEAPPELLIVRRSAEERREAVLGWLATARRDFWGQLPAACRHDHRPPPRTGGPANKNRVMNGIAAAMVLAGQVPAMPGDASLSGAKLFERVVQRVKRLLTLAGERGRLAVDPTGVRLRPENTVWMAGTDAWGGREIPCIRPRLLERLPTRPELRDAQEGHDKS